jgi:hypothetical protein
MPITLAWKRSSVSIIYDIIEYQRSYPLAKNIVQFTPRDGWEPTYIDDKLLTHTKKEDEPETTLGDVPMCTECDSITECEIVRHALVFERTYSIAVAIVECPRFIPRVERKNI